MEDPLYTKCEFPTGRHTYVRTRGTPTYVQEAHLRTYKIVHMCTHGSKYVHMHFQNYSDRLPHERLQHPV